MPQAGYLALVLEAYEAEVAGAAYFEGLIPHFPDQVEFLQRCVALERATALRLDELLRKYQLTPAARAILDARGAQHARAESSGDWRQLLHKSVEYYPRYVTEFQALEAMGPAEDQPVLAALTAHEVQLIDWMRAELTAGPASSSHRPAH